MPLTKEERELQKFKMQYFTRKNLRNAVKLYDERVIDEYIRDATKIIKAYKGVLHMIMPGGTPTSKKNNNTPFHTPRQSPVKPKTKKLKPPPPPPPMFLRPPNKSKNNKNNRIMVGRNNMMKELKSKISGIKFNE